MPDDTLRERFWAKVDKRGPDECWPWLAAKHPRGYGRFYPTRGTPVPAHRFAYEDQVGPIPEGLQIDHLCRNTSCVNPAHLEAVTGQENTLRGEGPTAKNAAKTHCHNGHPLSGDNLHIDPVRGWRYCRTCKNANLKHRGDPEEGKRLRELRKKAGVTQYQLADALDCSQTAVWMWEIGRNPVPPKAFDALLSKLGERDRG